MSKTNHAIALLTLALAGLLLPGCDAGDKPKSEANPTAAQPNPHQAPDPTPAAPQPVTVVFQVEATYYDMQTLEVAPVDPKTHERITADQAEHILSEAFLRETLNLGEIQATAWYKSFKGNNPAMFKALRAEVLSARQRPDSATFEVQAMTDSPADARAILTVIRDAYLREQPPDTGRDFAEEFAAANRQLDKTFTQVEQCNLNITRFLREHPLEGVVHESTRPAQEIQRMVLMKNELQESYDALSATYKQLKAADAPGSYVPTEAERKQIESTAEIVTLDRQLRNLREQKKQMLEQLGEEHALVQDVSRKINALVKEREDEYNKQVQALFNAKLEQATLGMQILTKEIEKVDQALAEWTAKRHAIVQMLQEYDTLKRQLEEAEHERRSAQETLDELFRAFGPNPRVTVTVVGGDLPLPAASAP